MPKGNPPERLAFLDHVPRRIHISTGKQRATGERRGRPEENRTREPVAGPTGAEIRPHRCGCSRHRDRASSVSWQGFLRYRPETVSNPREDNSDWIPQLNLP